MFSANQQSNFLGFHISIKYRKFIRLIKPLNSKLDKNKKAENYKFSTF